jgi:hypothetical protein
MADSPRTTSIELSIAQKLRRGYGIWWDLINTGIVVFLLSVIFLIFAMILLTGRLELLPFQELIWRQFIETVLPEKQSEIGLGVLGVTVSGASATALFLIRVGTARWAMNRRIGYIHGYFANEIGLACLAGEFDRAKLEAIFVAFISSSQNVFEQISETHRVSQIYFERARMRSYLFTSDASSGNIDAIRVAVDLYSAAAICQKVVVLPIELSCLSVPIKRSLAEC